MVYAADGGSSLTVSLVIKDCCLCGFPFPHCEIVVSSCRHVYHPWCALAVFSKASECCAVGCKQVQPIQWIMSFGWRGVRGWARTVTDDWSKMLVEGAATVAEGLASRKHMAKEIGTAIQKGSKFLYSMVFLNQLARDDGVVLSTLSVV